MAEIIAAANSLTLAGALAVCAAAEHKPRRCYEAQSA